MLNMWFGLEQPMTEVKYASQSLCPMKITCHAMSVWQRLFPFEVMQQVQEFAVEAVGWYSMPFPEQRSWNSNVEPIGPEGADVLAPRYFNGRKMTIYGGSSEVQRGIMSKVMLGL